MQLWKRRKAGHYYSVQFMFRVIYDGKEWKLYHKDGFLASYLTLRDAKAAAATIWSSKK